MYVYFCVYKVLYLLKKALKKNSDGAITNIYQKIFIYQKKPKIYINIYFKK